MRYMEYGTYFILQNLENWKEIQRPRKYPKIRQKSRIFGIFLRVDTNLRECARRIEENDTE